MKLLVVVADSKEVAPMKRLLAKSGLIFEGVVWTIQAEGFEGKPAMKVLRALKVELDEQIKQYGPFDVILAPGETAARLVLDTSSVNINKLRGRDFEYAYGVKKPGKKAGKAVEGVEEV